ncbi:hypothetical protein ONZ45_g7502 [Pleurotus djamor]|nr:hypothetical protein ONZ45_g7502 [Pleurotus djamor]
MSYHQYPPQMPPQRSYTAGPQPTHSYSQSVPNVYPNAIPNAYSQNMTPGPSGHGFRPIAQQQQQQHHIQQPVQPVQPPRTPSPFRRPLPSPQRSDPIPRSLTPGVSSPTSPPTSSFSNPASTFSLGSAGFAASNSALVRHSHSYSMSDAMQGGSPGSLPSPYPPNWSPSQSQQQQQQQQQIQRYHPQPPPPPQPQYRQSQQAQWMPQSQATAPYQQAPQTAYAAIHGSNPPQLPPINTGNNVRTSMFPPSNVPPTPTNPVRTYSQPPPSGNSSPTRRPLPTPGPPSHVTNTSSVFPDRAHARSPSPIKPNPPPRSQSPVKAIRDMFESRNSAHSNPPQRAPNVGPGALVLHGKAWSEDSDNGFKEAINNEPDRGRSGFSGMTGVRRQSPPKFFGSTEGGDSGPSTVKLVSSAERANDAQPRTYLDPLFSNPILTRSSGPSAYSALPPAASSLDGTKFVPMWKRGKTFTFDNTPSSRTSTPNNEVQSSSVSVYSQNIAGVGAGDNAAAKGRVLPQPTTSQLQSQRRSQESPPAQSKPSPPQVQSQIRDEPSRYQRSQSQTRQPVPETQNRTRSQPVPPPSPTKQPQTPTHSRFPSQSAATPNQRTANETRQPESTPTRLPQIRSQPLKSAAEIPQPDVRRSRAQPPRHTRSKSHGPPSAHPMPQPMHQQQRSEPVLPRGAPPGWKTTVNIPNLPPSPPVMGMKARSRSAGPPAINPSTSRSGSPTKNGRAPNGWRTSVSPNNKPPPPDIDPRTGEVRPPRHKPPEGWRSSVPRGQITQPPLHPSSPKKRAKVLEPEMTSRAPGGWRSTVSNHPPSPVKPSGHSGGPPAGWRNSAYAPPPPATSTTQQKRWSQPAPMSTPKASDRSNYGYGRTSGQYYPETPDGDSSLECDSTDAYSGIYDDEEGDSSFDAVATGDEETDGASVLSRDTGTTAESYDSGYERARAQLPRSPQYGIRELPKSNMSLPQEDALSTHPRSPQYGIRELPPSMRRGDTSNRGDANSTGPLPRPPVMSRGAVSQNNAPEMRPYTQNKAPNYSRPESSYGGSDMTSDTGSRRNSTFSTTSSKNDWPSNVPPLPRAPGMSRSSFGSDNSSTTDRRLAEQRIRRERDRIDLDDAPPVGFSALRRTPSPSAASVSVDDDYDFHTQRREFAPSQAFSSRPSTSQSYRSQASQPELPPRQSSPTRPLPQPSQLQRSRSQRSQANSQYQNTPSVPSTPSSYTTPLSPRQQLPSVPSTPSSRAPPLPPRQIPSIPPSPTTSQIEIQSPAPISGWGRSDLPKIEVDDEPASNSSSAPVIAVSAPSISISGIEDDDDANGMGPMISVAGPDDAKDDKPAKRPLPPLHRGGGLICGGCDGAIVGRIVSAMGLRWHPGCFKCTICEELLEHVSSYEHEGRPYCHLDYHENFAPKCYSCKTAIIEERFISLDDPALGKRTYHEQHFFCAECGDPFLAPSSNKRSGNNDLEVNVSGDGEFLLDDDVGFTVYKGHPYCEACHVRLRMPKCKKCKKSIRDGMQAVEALGGKWCYECFVCTNDVWSTLEECKFWTWCLKPILRPSTTFPARTYWPVDDDVDRSQTLLDVLAVQTHGKVDELRIGWYNPDEIHLDGSLAVDEDCILSASTSGQAADGSPVFDAANHRLNGSLSVFVPNGTEATPGRLLDLGDEMTCTKAKLVQPDEGSAPRYATLSYCWGTTLDGRTTAANVKNYEAEVDVDTLPRTIQDAVTVSKALGLRYLWVDRLCIIQEGDNGEDMKKELPKMASIYKGSSVTITAARAKDSEDGFLHSRNPISYEETGAFALPCRLPNGQMDTVYLCNEQDYVDLEENVVNLRAWTMQEQILSPRLLVFGERRTVWLCNTSDLADGGRPLNIPQEARQRNGDKLTYADETYAQVYTPFQGALDWGIWPLLLASESELDALKATVGEEQIRVAMLMQWHRSVENYTKRQLSVPADKLLAIGGLARTCAKILRASGGYVAGIWGYDLFTSLGWEVRAEDLKPRLPGYVAPTWSWASVAGPVQPRAHWTQTVGNGRFLRTVFELENVNDPFGRYKRAELILQGELRKCRRGSGPTFLLDPDTEEEIYVTFSPDAIENDEDFLPGSQDDLYLLNLRDKDEVTEKFNPVGLVLRPAPDGVRYRRTGRFHQGVTSTQEVRCPVSTKGLTFEEYMSVVSDAQQPLRESAIRDFATWESREVTII